MIQRLWDHETETMRAWDYETVWLCNYETMRLWGPCTQRLWDIENMRPYDHMTIWPYDHETLRLGDIETMDSCDTKREQGNEEDGQRTPILTSSLTLHTHNIHPLSVQCPSNVHEILTLPPITDGEQGWLPWDSHHSVVLILHGTHHHHHHHQMTTMGVYLLGHDTQHRMIFSTHDSHQRW